MNAGCFGSETKDIFIKAKCLSNQGELIELTYSEELFSYRKNNFLDKLIKFNSIYFYQKDCAQFYRKLFAVLKFYLKLDQVFWALLFRLRLDGDEGLIRGLIGLSGLSCSRSLGGTRKPGSPAVPSIKEHRLTQKSRERPRTLDSEALGRIFVTHLFA